MNPATPAIGRERPWRLRLSSIEATEVDGGVLDAMAAHPERIAPKGSTAVSNMLNLAADSLVKAGDLGIFTPNLFFLARRSA